MSIGSTAFMLQIHAVFASLGSMWKARGCILLQNAAQGLMGLLKSGLMGRVKKYPFFQKFKEMAHFSYMPYLRATVLFFNKWQTILVRFREKTLTVKISPMTKNSEIHCTPMYNVSCEVLQHLTLKLTTDLDATCGMLIVRIKQVF
jgi:hypothetical protein